MFLKQGVNVEGPEVSATPNPYKTMTVVINEADNNPFTRCSYADDAIEMLNGQDVDEWRDFFGYKPCLFKDGEVVGYLNPNDYTKFENGDPADITSGNFGDVMIEFPRRGIRVNKSDNLITVSMTENPDNPDFTYYAHSRGDTNKDYFYLGAYVSYVDTNSQDGSHRLRSISNITATAALSLSEYREYAHKNGTGYETMTFYQWQYTVVMYVLQFKDTDSSTTMGYGFHQYDVPVSTGATNTLGLMHKSSGVSDHLKLFGVEDLYGHIEQLLDGFYIDTTDIYCVATDNFANGGEGYNKTNVKLEGAPCYGVITKMTGTSEIPFMPPIIEGAGSFSTYYCDSASLSVGRVCCIGGGHQHYQDPFRSGVFQFETYKTDTDRDTYIGTRLSYY